MNKSPDEFKTNNEISSNLPIGHISILSDPPESSGKNNYLGDVELESLKKQHVYFDGKGQSTRMPREGVSSFEVKEKDLKTNGEIENCEMVSTDSGCSIGVDSNSNSSNESVLETISKSELDQEEYPKFDNFSKPLAVDVKTEKITTDISLEPGNFTTSNDYVTTGTELLEVKSENDPKGNPVKESPEKLSLKFSDGKVNEACSEAVPNTEKDGDCPLVKNESSLKAGSMEALPKLPYRNAANPFEVVVPFVGKKPDWGDCKPFHHRYDLAIKINRMKFEQSGDCIPEMSYHEMMKKRQTRTKEQVEEEDRQVLQEAACVAAYVAKKILIRILLQMQKDEPDEEALIRYFKRFLDAPVSPVAMLYIPQFVHTVMYIRGSTFFTYKVRKMAERCYYRVHVMFPIPPGYNFETVYTSEVKKFLPESIEGLHDCPMEYDELESQDESDDSAFSEDSKSND